MQWCKRTQLKISALPSTADDAIYRAEGTHQSRNQSSEVAGGPFYKRDKEEKFLVQRISFPQLKGKYWFHRTPRAAKPKTTLTTHVVGHPSVGN